MHRRRSTSASKDARPASSPPSTTSGVRKAGSDAAEPSASSLAGRTGAANRWWQIVACSRAARSFGSSSKSVPVGSNAAGWSSVPVATSSPSSVSHKRPSTMGGSIAYRLPPSGARSCIQRSSKGGRSAAPPRLESTPRAADSFSRRALASSFAGSIVVGYAVMMSPRACSMSRYRRCALVGELPGRFVVEELGSDDAIGGDSRADCRAFDRFACGRGR